MQIQEALQTGTLLRSGDRFYEIKKVLGQGGFGITYLATSTVYVGNIPMEAQFAIKEHYISSMNERQGTSVAISNANNTAEIKESIDSFIVEAQRLNKLSLNHPGLVRVNESFRANGTAYYVMEYIKGQSLREFVKHSSGGRLSEEEALKLFRPIAETIGYLHENKVTHLDIKPDNILIRENGQPVIIDFGLSKHYSSKGTPTSTIKAAGCSAGYSPMEQYVGITTFTPEADIYALAATLLHMLTGKDPMISTEITPDIIRKSLPNDVSEQTKEAIAKGMEKLQENRTHSVSILSNSLYILNNYNDQEHQDSHKTIKKQLNIGKVNNRISFVWIISISILLLIMSVVTWRIIVERQECNILTDYTKIRIGDYVYSDGSFSHEKLQEKKCVGVVFNLTTTEYEKKLGYTHGHIVALKDFVNKEQSRFTWKKAVEGEPSKRFQFTLKSFNYSSGVEDRNGLQHCNEIVQNGLKVTSGDFMLLDNSDAIALSCCYSEKLPDNFSNWYLPALGEWYDILTNLGYAVLVKDRFDFYFLNEPLIRSNLNNIGLSIKAEKYIDWQGTHNQYVYWTSTYCGYSGAGECLNNHFFAISGLPYKVETLRIYISEQEEKYQIRTVAAF